MTGRRSNLPSPSKSFPNGIQNDTHCIESHRKEEHESALTLYQFDTTRPHADCTYIRKNRPGLPTSSGIIRLEGNAHLMCLSLQDPPIKVTGLSENTVAVAIPNYITFN